jgi:hypothetical protein
MSLEYNEKKRFSHSGENAAPEVKTLFFYLNDGGFDND